MQVELQIPTRPQLADRVYCAAMLELRAAHLLERAAHFRGVNFPEGANADERDARVLSSVATWLRLP